MRKTMIFAWLIVLASFALAIYFYPQMPEIVASHWDANGNVNGYMSKFWGLFLMPIIATVMLLFFVLIPKLDPLKKNIEKFRKDYDGFILIIILFLFYIYMLTILWNIDYRFNIGQMLAPAFAVLFYYMGVLVENAKRNWFIGIRTPWTLSNDKVWDKTHKLGGKLFNISGAIAFIGVFLSNYLSFLVVIVPVILFSIYSIIYSYIEYKKIVKK